MAFKMNKNKAGSIYQKSVYKNSTSFKLRTGDEKDVEMTDVGEVTGHIKPRGYDETKSGLDAYPEVKKVAEKTLKPGWAVKKTSSGNEYFTYKGEVVYNPNPKDVYKTTTRQVLHRGNVGINERDKELLHGAGYPGNTTRTTGTGK